MNTIVLPLVLLGLAAGIVLAHAPSRLRSIGFIAFAVLDGLVASVPSVVAVDTAVVACWTSAAACALAIHWPRTPARVVLVLAGASGVCAGALAAAGGVRPEGYVLLPAFASLALASWCLRHGARVAVHVVASWLIAVVLLVASLHALPVTPGDRPDHLE